MIETSQHEVDLYHTHLPLRSTKQNSEIFFLTVELRVCPGPVLNLGRPWRWDR